MSLTVGGVVELTEWRTESCNSFNIRRLRRASAMVIEPFHVSRGERFLLRRDRSTSRNRELHAGLPRATLGGVETHALRCSPRLNPKFTRPRARRARPRAGQGTPAGERTAET